MSRPPSFPLVVAETSSRRASRSCLIVPSSSFRATFPVKPSATTTSAAKRKSSLASVFPLKLSPLSRSRACASRTRWLPFSGSSPIESSRTSGLGRSRISSAKIEPMCANWTRLSGGDDGVCPTLADGAVRHDERAVPLRAHGLGGLVVHRDELGRLDELEAAGVEPGRAEEDRLDRRAPRLESAGDDLLRCAVAPHRVDRDAG